MHVPMQQSASMGSFGSVGVAAGSFAFVVEKAPPVSDTATVLNLVVNIAGAGVLFLPQAMHQASLVIGNVMLVAFACITVFTARLVVLGCEVTNASSLPDVFASIVVGLDGLDATDVALPEDVYMARQRRRRRISLALDTMVSIYVVGILGMYISIIADNLCDVAYELGLGHKWQEPLRYYYLCFLVFFLLTCFRQLRELSWMTRAALGSIVAIAVVIAGEYAASSIKHHTAAARGVRWLSPTTSAFLSLPTFVVALGYHYCIPQVYHAMGPDATPDRFHRAVIIATVLSTVMYSVLATIGYLTVGAHADDNANLMNLFPRDDRIVSLVRAGIAAHIVCVFPLMALTVRDSLHRALLRIIGEDELAEDPNVMLTAHRSMIVLEAAAVCAISVVAATSTNDLSTYVNVFGTAFGIFLVFIVPAVIGLCVAFGAVRSAKSPLPVGRHQLHALGFHAVGTATHDAACVAVVGGGFVAIVAGTAGLLGYIS